MGWEGFTVKFWIYSQLSLFTTVMSYNVTINTASVNTEPLLLGEIQGELPMSPWWQIFFLSTDQYMICFTYALMTPYLIYIVHSLPLNSWPTALEFTSEWNLPNAHIFSIRHITAFLHWGTLDSTLRQCFRTILNSEVTIKKHKNAKKVALNRSQKDAYL